MYGSSASLSGTVVDHVFFLIVAISAVLLLLIMTLMIAFAVRYRRSRRPRAQQIAGNLWLEILWTIVPVGLVLAMFYYGFEGFKVLRDVPPDAMLVKVTGRMWDWRFRYENGKETGKLFVPLDRPVKLALTSLDVNHSFYIPAFRIKEDAVPGRENYLWFKPQSTGPVDIFCAEYCGQQHAYMMSEVIVMTPEDFAAWYAVPADSLAAGRDGPALLAEQGCLACHSLDGSPRSGPTLRGLYGSRRVVLWNGQERTAVADEEYLRRAIRQPDAEVVGGYEAIMPVPEKLGDEELQAIIDYLKTLGGPP
jgi:cytochrome c oxidase subunit 2